MHYFSMFDWRRQQLLSLDLKNLLFRTTIFFKSETGCQAAPFFAGKMASTTRVEPVPRSDLGRGLPEGSGRRNRAPHPSYRRGA
jgi:hypothetical protein